MKQELASIEKNKTWTLTKLPRGRKDVGSKWVFKVKYIADGTIERFKARIVATGYLQTKGVDYFDTFAPVARVNSIRMILAIATNCNWEVHQMEVMTIFLHGELEEEVFMEQPKGYRV